VQSNVIPGYLTPYEKELSIRVLKSNDCMTLTKATNVNVFMIICDRTSKSSVIGLYYSFQLNTLVFTKILLI